MIARLSTFYMYIAIIAVFLTILPLFLNLYQQGINSSVVGHVTKHQSNHRIPTGYLGFS